jgi:hypothetical protein
MKRTLAIVVAALIMGAVVYSIFLLRQSLVRERELGAGGRFPDLQVRLIGAEPQLARLPAKKKTLIVFFRYD